MDAIPDLFAAPAAPAPASAALAPLRAAGFDVAARNHAEAILSVDFAAETAELIRALGEVAIPAAEIIASGGGEAASTQRLRRVLTRAGWGKHVFEIVTTVNGRPLGDGTSHEVDHVRAGAAGTIALEIEWNNKDPFFDRDLENFQRLHAAGIIGVGVIVTRGAGLQAAMAGIVEETLRAMGVGSEDGLAALGVKARTDRQRRAVARAVAAGRDFPAAFTPSFVADKFGPASTHWAKLAERIARGVGGPCPLLLIGLPARVVAPYSAAGAAPEL